MFENITTINVKIKITNKKKKRLNSSLHKTLKLRPAFRC